MGILQLHEFMSLVHVELDRPLNKNQRQAVEAPVGSQLFIVAGPGSGKTTVLALRALKLVFVDDVEPSSILATTFTRKAAKELRSRILSWGDRLRQVLLTRTLAPQGRGQIERIDFNSIVTGTLDSIAETQLVEDRIPGTQPPVVLEEFVAEALMLRQGLFPNRRDSDPDLRQYIIQLNNTSYGLNATKLSNTVRKIRDQCVHDGVDMNAYRVTQQNCPVCGQHPHKGVEVACTAIDDYLQELESRGVVDFAGLEAAFLASLEANSLPSLTSALRVLLVDEYQDTNLLQERIYFTLAEHVMRQGGGVTVVGDDDQSLFRFRGATVELFQEFRHRFESRFGLAPLPIFLAENYRSTRSIVDFCNAFAANDSAYQTIRVVGKPPISAARRIHHNPQILGMFRDDVQTLARDLSSFVHQVFVGNGYSVPGLGFIQRSIGGSLGDCALLCHSPQEVRENVDPHTLQVQRRQRLPFWIRQELASLQPAIPVFNPRGRNLAFVPEVACLCGLILECLDPAGQIQAAAGNLPREAVETFNRWRGHANRHIRNQSQLVTTQKQKNTLSDFVASWQKRVPQARSSWPDQIGLVDLCYKLVAWIPEMQDDVEGLVYLEVVLRTIMQASLFGSFGGDVVFRNRFETPSIKAVLRDILVPIAMGAVEVDEDLLETLPRDRLNVLSIHQSKGLEFPMVIVDVGSDFKSDHHTQVHLRYPQRGGAPQNLEDELLQFSPRGGDARGGRDRAFDDLVRLYFVAFSRAQDVLLLVGLNSVKDGYPRKKSVGHVRNVATGWDRNGTWHWGRGLPNLVHI